MKPYYWASPLLATVLISAIGRAGVAAQKPPTELAPHAPVKVTADALLAAYEAGDDEVVGRTITTVAQFEALRAELLMPVVYRWERAPRRIHYAFLLEVAKAGLDAQAEYWLDVLQEGRKFIMRRPAPPGSNSADDAFEIAWHKTAVALLCSQRRPDYVEKHGVAPLRTRMAATSSDTGGPLLIDPWIELARGFSEEGFSLLTPPARLEIGTVGPKALIARSPAALEHYSAAMAYPSTRAEAAARKAWLLVRLNRAPEALTTLDLVEDGWTADPVIRYWIRLFRGAALEKLNRPEEAIRSYHDALAIVPSAQSPRVAIMGLELASERRDEAYALATAVRTAPEAYTDPWWLYGFGDRRFLLERLAALRAEARKR
jgi:hypothetical protein